MKLEEMQTTADALRWALHRLETAGVDCGDYFAKADAILHASRVAPDPLRVPFARMRDLMSTSAAMTLHQDPNEPLYTGLQVRAALNQKTQEQS